MAKAKKRAPRRKKAAAGSIGLSPPRKPRTVDARVTARSDGRGRRATAAPSSARIAIRSAARRYWSWRCRSISVEPTPYQRDPSETHIKKLMTVIEKVGRFLDPLVLIRQDDGYWTPNGNHRLQAMKKLGAKSIIGLLVPDPEVAFKILALNTEKAHNVKEKSLETIRMARALAGRKQGQETDFAFEFEQAQFLTLGAAYEQRKSLSGGAYTSVLRRIDDFLDEPMAEGAARNANAAATRCSRSMRRSARSSTPLKAKGLTSPYLKAFVVARINYIRFSKATEFDFDEVIDKLTAVGEEVQRREGETGRRRQGRRRRRARRRRLDAQRISRLQPFRALDRLCALSV